MLEALGRDVSRVPSLPLTIARAAPLNLEGYWQITGRSGEPPLTRTTVELIGDQVTVSDAKARRELGYTPVISRARGLAELRAKHSA